MGAPTILRLKGVTKRFGTAQVLHGIDLDISQGEFLTIVGPSGCGKSTLIRLMVGMEDLSGGTIWLHDRRLDTVPAHKRPTCMVFQSLALFPHRSVGENIEFPLKIRGVDRAARRARTLELLDLVRLPQAIYGRRIQDCSGGERQRVALARALAFEPEILFFDEPLSALDYRLRKTLEKELKDLHARTGKTFVYITHSLEEAMVMSDRIAIMRAGRLEQVAAADEIYARPVSRFVAEFMGEVNLFEVQRDRDGALVGAGIEGHAPLGGAASAGMQGAGRLTMMVRPEFLRFLPEGGRADFTLRGILTGQYILGSRIQYRVETAAGPPVTVEKLREDAFAGRPGDPVVLGFDAAHAHLIGGGYGAS